MYFTSRQFPQLENLSIKQRTEIVRQAVLLLSTPKKTLLNVFKLALLTPIFLLLANIDNWWLLIYLLIVGLLYPLITTPLTLHFVKDHIDEAKQKVLSNE